MKLITELIEFALKRDMLTEEHKRKLQNEGFYTFYTEEEESCSSPNDSDYEDDHEEEKSSDSFEDSHEDEIDRTYYGEFYRPGKLSGKRRQGKRNSPSDGPKLTVEELNQRVQEDWKKLTEEFPLLEPLWDSWKAGKLERVLADGFTLNDVYSLINAERPDYQNFSGPAPTAFRQLLRQVGNVKGKYSWVVKTYETAAMVEFIVFRQQIFEEVRTLYETDRDRFAALSSQNGKLYLPFEENTDQKNTTSMRVWTILNISSIPVTPERIHAIRFWKPELTIAMQINLDYITELLRELQNRDWSSLRVVTERIIENAILKTVIIPNDATEIEDGAFCCCRSLTSVSIPKSVTKIGGGAFRGCCSLTSVVIPEGVTSIESAAFRGCSSLYSLSIPEGVTDIGSNAFGDCPYLTIFAQAGSAAEKYAKAENVSMCSSLSIYQSPYRTSFKFSGTEITKFIGKETDAVIPEGVTKIGYQAFSGCSSLKSVTIPEGVTKIEMSAFQGCCSLTLVSIPESLTDASDAFQGCAAPGKALLSADGKILLDVNDDISGMFVIPETVIVIFPHAFDGCSSLTSLVIPEGVKEIGSGAFYDCSSLTSVSIPKGVNEIRGNAFRYCSSLTSVAIPEGVTTIGNGAFQDCSSLMSVAIPESVKKIGLGAFNRCSSLTSVVIPEGVKEIGNYAFLDCSSLKSLVIPQNVNEIGMVAFENCPNLTIHAPAGSYAEKYAEENKIPFQPLEEEKQGSSCN